MTFITAASIEDLLRKVAEKSVYLGRRGAVLDHVEYREDLQRIPGSTQGYCSYEASIYFHWAALDEATHRPARQQQSAGGAG